MEDISPDARKFTINSSRPHSLTEIVSKTAYIVLQIFTNILGDLNLVAFYSYSCMPFYS